MFFRKKFNYKNFFGVKTLLETTLFTSMVFQIRAEWKIIPNNKNFETKRLESSFHDRHHLQTTPNIYLFSLLFETPDALFSDFNSPTDFTVFAWRDKNSVSCFFTFYVLSLNLCMMLMMLLLCYQLK